MACAPSQLGLLVHVDRPGHTDHRDTKPTGSSHGQYATAAAKRLWCSKGSAGTSETHDLQPFTRLCIRNVQPDCSCVLHDPGYLDMPV